MTSKQYNSKMKIQMMKTRETHQNGSTKKKGIQLQDLEMIKRRENKRMIKRRKKKTYNLYFKRYARRKSTKNKSTIIGAVQLEERCQQQSKR